MVMQCFDNLSAALNNMMTSILSLHYQNLKSQAISIQTGPIFDNIVTIVKMEFINAHKRKMHVQDDTIKILLKLTNRYYKMLNISQFNTLFSSGMGS